MQRNYWTVLNLLTSEHREAFRKPVRRPRNTQTIYSSIESDFLLIQVSNKSPGAESYIQLFPAHQEIKGFLETTDKIMNLDVSGHLLQDDTSYYPLSFEYCTCERGCTGRRRGSSHIFQNKMILWLSLVLNWIIKMDNSCSANFLQKPKETMNRLHDENCRRSQKAECSVFYSPQASSGFHLLCVRWLQGEEWMIHREREAYTSITLWMHSDGMQDSWILFLYHKIKSWNAFPSYS